MFQKRGRFVLVLLLAGMLAACGREQEIENKESQGVETTVREDAADEDAVDDDRGESGEPAPDENDTEKDAKADAMKELFGESCIAEQTFEVELSEYDGKVYFVPFAPSEDDPQFRMQIIQNGEVLKNISAGVPKELAEEQFESLDAVAFFDVNYDDNTDIVLIETYGGTSFAAVYYGFAADANEYESYFFLQETLSENITSKVEVLTIPEIRSLLTEGKKNGTFSSFQEAYTAVSRLSELESTGERQYNLIYFDGDDIPELVTGVDGYYVSLYTYHDGKVYTLMDCWGYGAMGNAGYEYAPGKNSLRNYNTDYAGAICYTTYMAVSDRYTMDVVAQIETYNFDDVNGNGMPDEGEYDSIGYYGVSYIDGVEVSDEKCKSYDVGGYEYIRAVMSCEALQTELK